MFAETKVCLSCNKNLHGRIDKKYCNDYCRNTHHNRLNSEGNNYVRNINYSLRKNRRILESLLARKRPVCKTSRQQLNSKGFVFSFFTHTITDKKGQRYFFCYDYGYQMLEEECFLIVKKNLPALVK